jgi:transposase
MIPIPSGVRVWIATGHTDMRRGMNGLALQVQQALKRDPHAGDLFVFRGSSHTTHLALSRCQIELATNLLALLAHAAETSRHICRIDALKARCVLGEGRWRAHTGKSVSK